MLNTPSDLATSLFEDEGHKQLHGSRGEQYS